MSLCLIFYEFVDFYADFYGYAKIKVKIMVENARRRGTHLKVLPQGFAKRRKNSSMFHYK